MQSISEIYIYIYIYTHTRTHSYIFTCIHTYETTRSSCRPSTRFAISRRQYSSMVVISLVRPGVTIYVDWRTVNHGPRMPDRALLHSVVLNRMESDRCNNKVSSAVLCHFQEFGALVFAATMNVRQEGRAGSTPKPESRKTSSKCTACWQGHRSYTVSGNFRM